MRPRVLYVAGLGRSGSTLLARLLAELPGTVSVGEAHHLWQTGAVRAAGDELCGCGRTYLECGFWTGVLEEALGDPLPLEEMRRQADAVARIRRIPRLERGGDPRFEGEVREYGEVWRRIYEHVAGEDGSWVIDVSKDLGPLFLLARIERLELRMLHLVRDPRAVAYSWSTRKRRPEFLDREAYLDRPGPLVTSGRWIYSNLLAERFTRRFPEQSMRLRYEDLVARPREELAAIADWLGLEGRPNFRNETTVVLESRSCLISGNPMRFGGDTLTIAADERWKDAMPAFTRAAVAAATWPWRRRYAY